VHVFHFHIGHGHVAIVGDRVCIGYRLTDDNGRCGSGIGFGDGEARHARRISDCARYDVTIYSRKGDGQ